MGATRIMLIRHAEKPGDYHGLTYKGVRATGQACRKSLVTLGWERAGALITLFAPPWGPRAPELSTPGFLFAADPSEKAHHAKKPDHEPSQRPYQTLTAVAARLDLAIDTNGRKSAFKRMADAALDCAGVVLIAWQHQDIPAIADHILEHTRTPAGRFALPASWPEDRYDLVWVLDRPRGSGPIAAFTQVPQLLLAGDQSSVIAG